MEGLTPQCPLILWRYFSVMHYAMQQDFSQYVFGFDLHVKQEGQGLSDGQKIYCGGNTFFGGGGACEVKCQH